MDCLKRGHYFSNHKKTNHLGHLTLTEAESNNEPVDWHYHENAYFSYTLEGHCIEKNKKESYEVKPGTLLFHNWQDVHTNGNHSSNSKTLYLEFEKDWYPAFDCDIAALEGSFNIENPFLKALFNQIYLEARIQDETFQLAVESLVLNVFALLKKDWPIKNRDNPKWVGTVKEMIHSEFNQKLSLQDLSLAANIHPAHLSRDFSRYFGATLGNYIRRVKVEHAAVLLSGPDSFTEIAYHCGFADQSHFIRCFKASYNMTPKMFRTKITTR
ncbi:helix-turn-helix transcriptional regulator [Spongiimicrobium sp. 3-5]|uniref:helix-turn-helix transcriptional regulator n=1 Tax=Spongiimicrobium sp. 3-5 TaxID=3332596 RepID=UPI0039803680